jgi:CHASE3 domain sensor protein
MGAFRFATLTLGRKLYGSFALVFVVAAVVGAVAITSMDSMNRRTRDVTGTVLPSVQAVDDMTATAEDLRSLISQFTLA